MITRVAERAAPRGNEAVDEGPHLAVEGCTPLLCLQPVRTNDLEEDDVEPLTGRSHRRGAEGGDTALSASPAAARRAGGGAAGGGTDAVGQPL